MSQNPNCDGARCTWSVGEVRVLPLGAGGNLILCHTCFAHEIRFRKERNKELSADARFDLPTWESLKIYTGAP
jgi:hypothetical protein